MTIDTRLIQVETDDGHQWSLHASIPAAPSASVLWMPAMGVAARHYQPFAHALAAGGRAVFVHEWRGNGSSNRRAGRNSDWNYDRLLLTDLPASVAAVAATAPGLPKIIGGHSLGGQLACCGLGLMPDCAQALWLVASGAPYWRAFPRPHRYWLPLAYQLLPWLARVRGSLPGHRIGFGGNEARGVIHDWAHSGLAGRYALPGRNIDLDVLMAQVTVPVTAIVLRDDWLAPASSLRFLLGKLNPKASVVHTLDSAVLGSSADHFHWMKRPGAVTAALQPQRTPPAPGTPNPP